MSEPSTPTASPWGQGQAAWSGDGQAQRSRFEPSEKHAELSAAGERTTSSHKPLQPEHPRHPSKVKGMNGKSEKG